MRKKEEGSKFDRFTLTDVVDGASTELAVELLGSEAPQVVNGEGPEVEHVVPGEGVSLLDHHHLTAQQGQLDGCPQTTWTPTDNQTLNRVKEEEKKQNGGGGVVYKEQG